MTPFHTRNVKNVDVREGALPPVLPWSWDILARKKRTVHNGVFLLFLCAFARLGLIYLGLGEVRNRNNGGITVNNEQKEAHNPLGMAHSPK